MMSLNTSKVRQLVAQFERELKRRSKNRGKIIQLMDEISECNLEIIPDELFKKYDALLDRAVEFIYESDHE